MNLKFLNAGLVALIAAGSALADEMPPRDAEPCRAPVLIPETFETVTEQVLDQPERTEIRVIPAEYETEPERILVKEASVELRVVPAVYEAVTEQVLVRPERTETVVIPAEYETFTEQVLVRQAYTTWKLKDPSAGQVEPAGTSGELSEGDLLVPVDVPAEYETVTRTRIVKPEESETRIVPAEYRTIVKQVLVEPARVEQVEVPAEYETVLVERLVAPAREEIIVIPATYRTVEKRVLAGGGTAAWRDAPCASDVTPAMIRAVQTALGEAGHAVKADGVLGPATLSALEAFQRRQGLGVGSLTNETLAALGVKTD
ncbi:MAG: peptidoglycan-binding protein, partial [Hyphomonas sp.]|nr:peptidoglycan-binding protein [Hyphomonas sp.]